jgi:DNA polymerase-3 subunit gamma/tau
MVTALYRRYRPETFAEMIGQSQVTDPLMTALRTNRVNHAYLFSGPRGCGKTTSARILARCLNCAEGPTDTPCGVCPSCVELSRDGGGSLDVVEIDAASHNGVDDARDIRERAVFAPARDRFKIFILDEAHMVTPQGFNALLKIVEEPPEHVKFIFATTEPDKVIGTIRSRTHHYPFRLVPPAQLLAYVAHLCETEGVQVAPGVLPLVVRAGGGSPRDTLSLLDQLMAGSENNIVEYERAVALLGYTHSALLAEMVDAIGVKDAAAAFDVVDRVIQTGQDPRRFVEDLLERLRDIVIVNALAGGSAQAPLEAAAAVLRGVPEDEILAMQQQSQRFGRAELSRTADIVNSALTEMTGATSPRLHLELMIARVLVPASDDSERGSLARIERLERRIGVDAGVGGGGVVGGSVVGSGVVGGAAGSAPAFAPAPVSAPASVVSPPVSAPQQAPAPLAPAVAPPVSAPAAVPAAASVESVSAAPVSVPALVVPTGPVTLQQVKDTWPQILDAVQQRSRAAWLVVFALQVRGFEGDVLTLGFASQSDIEAFKKRAAPGDGVPDILREAILGLLGVRVMYVAKVETAGDSAAGSRQAPASQAPAAQPSGPVRGAPVQARAEPQSSAQSGPQSPATGRANAQPAAQPAATPPAATTSSWATVAIPQSDSQSEPEPPSEEDREPEPDFGSPANMRSALESVSAAIIPEPEPELAATPPATAPVDLGASDGHFPAPASAVAQAAAAQAAAPAPTPVAQAAPERVARPAVPAQAASGKQRYGEAVVREILGAKLIEEKELPPRDAPSTGMGS